MNALDHIHTLLFDAFGTMLDLADVHVSGLRQFLGSRHSTVAAEEMWSRWRYRQRIEQYQDNELCAGHYGYLDSSRRALAYTLRAAKIAFDAEDIARIMAGWQQLKPFPDVVPALQRLKRRFKLVVLSNGEPAFLAHLVMNGMRFEFDKVISVQDVGVFKPHPRTYRYAARVLGAEPCDLLMVSSNSFDVMGARASGLRAAYVNRYDLPYDETPYRFDLEVGEFSELSHKLLTQ